MPGRGPADSASKLVFCDLAACEPVRNGAAAGRGGGKAAADAAHVSKSLLALGNVISAASNPRRNNGHVPYRDSLLTRILQVCALPPEAAAASSIASVNMSADRRDVSAEATLLQLLHFRSRWHDALDAHHFQASEGSVRPAAQHCVTCVRPRQDCPGKATHTVLLACVSAADICHEQTLQTLRFAERARSRNLPGAAPLLPTAAPESGSSCCTQVSNTKNSSEVLLDW